MTEHKLKGSIPRIVLPVTLSQAARRSALVMSGVEPEPHQDFVVENLAELDRSDRERLVDLWEKINVHDPAAADSDEWWSDEITEPRNDGYLWLHRGLHDRWARYWPGTEGAALDLDEVFFANGHRTVSTLDAFRASLGDDEQAAFVAMLAGAPLVEDLGDADHLALEVVLAAYERALEFAERLIALTDTGTPAPQGFRPRPFMITDDAVFLFPAGGSGADPSIRVAAILKGADAGAYDRAVELLKEFDVPEARQAIADKIDRVCFHWWASHSEEQPDLDKVEWNLDTALMNASSDAASAQASAEQRARYEECRARWITKHGSPRLRRAAERGYKHDGIYRDERLEIELPGFVGSLGRKPNVRELVNPSADALELEAEALARAEALGISGEQVRLVYAQTGLDTDLADGEYVQITDYLGRHTVWQQVSDEPNVPF